MYLFVPPQPLYEIFQQLVAERPWRYLRYLHLRAGLRMATDVRSVLCISVGRGEAEVALAWEYPELRFEIASPKKGAKFTRARELANKLGLRNVSFSSTDLTKAPRRRGAYDFVAAVDVLEHFQDVATAASNLQSLSRGWTFVLVPFAEAKAIVDEEKRRDAVEKHGRQVVGFDAKSLLRLFPEAVALRGWNWHDGGAELQRRLSSLDGAGSGGVLDELLALGEKDVRPGWPARQSEAAGIWVLSGGNPPAAGVSLAAPLPGASRTRTGRWEPLTERRLIEMSGMFDEEFYARTYGDVPEGRDALGHYLECGAAEGRWPNPDFDSLRYARAAKLEIARINPLAHYLFEGRSRKIPTRGSGAVGSAGRASEPGRHPPATSQPQTPPLARSEGLTFKPPKSLTPTKRTATRYSLDAAWEIELKQPGDIDLAKLERGPAPAALLHLAKKGTGSYYRVVHRLAAAHLLKREGHALHYVYWTDQPDLLEWSAIVEQSGKGSRRLIVKGSELSTERDAHGVTVRGKVPLQLGDPNNEHCLAFQCSTLAGTFRLLELGVSTEHSTPARAAFPRAPSSATSTRSTFQGQTRHRSAQRTTPPDIVEPLLDTIQRLKGEHRTPYYDRLSLAIHGISDPSLITEVWRTLEDIDIKRYGQVPAAKRPLVSVVMPTHNRGHIILDAVNSVLAQTYRAFELLIGDDASDDATPKVLQTIKDARIRVFSHTQRRGAAAARNTCLKAASGELIAYLDSDNLWHPRFLELIVEEFERWPGNVAAYASYFDVRLHSLSNAQLLRANTVKLHLEDQLAKPYVDLNSFAHRRELVDVFGGFDEQLLRRQDYDIISRYCWIREPRHIPRALNIYQRSAELAQITDVQRDNKTQLDIVSRKVASYYATGLPASRPNWLKKVSVLSWDMSRNHFAKAFAVAEALSRHLEVELISFRFFEDPIFPPLANVPHKFELKSFEGGRFPAFLEQFNRAAQAITGDVIYAIKPRLPSFGLALLANHRTGTPIFLEANDLETVVASPQSNTLHVGLPLAAVFDALAEAQTPYADVWSQVLDPLVEEIPTLYTHNINLNLHYGRRCLYMRNIKDAADFDPEKVDRQAVRNEFGFSSKERVILFGGLVRKHKGIFELVELLERLDDPRYRLLVVGSRETPDIRKLGALRSKSVTILPPQSPARMAALNHAADVVVLWLDPDVPAGHYQSPYKMTDALAMGPAIIASPTSDLADFAERGLMWTVPFGDFDALAATIDSVFSNESERLRRQVRARQLFLREFSYASVFPAFALGAALLRERSKVYAVSERFTAFFTEFCARSGIVTDSSASRRAPTEKWTPTSSEDKTAGDHGREGRTPTAPSTSKARSEDAGSRNNEADDASIVVVQPQELAKLRHRDPDGVAVVMPCVDVKRAFEAARLLLKRAGRQATVFLVTDPLHRGFVGTLNEAAARLDVKYLVYVRETAFPGVDWLQSAYDALEATGKGLLAFNTGHWSGQAASFGMVRCAWCRALYNGSIQFPGYASSHADSELTLFARLSDALVFEPGCVLVDIEPTQNVAVLPESADFTLFANRFRGGFDARFTALALAPFEEEYLQRHEDGAGGATAKAPTDDSIQLLDVERVAEMQWSDPHGIAVIMPCIDTEKGLKSARHLLELAGIEAKLFVVVDTLRQGFIKTLNDTVARLDVRYVVYLAEDALPGADWLKIAHSLLEESGKGLLAFNCAKWHGRIAAFGMVRLDWVRKLYGGDVLYSGYKAHRADNELTVIARVTDQYLYGARALLVEYDARKAFRKREEDASNFTVQDKVLFTLRFKAGFAGLADLERLKPLAKAYFVRLDAEPAGKRSPPSGGGVRPGRRSTGVTADTSSAPRHSRGETLQFLQKPLDQAELETLKEESVAKGLADEPDSFVLYRIIGNDPHPRHEKGQSRRNLRFILDNEEPFDGCEKRFIVNRIIDPSEENAILELLRASGLGYSVIPFVRDEYRRVGFDPEVLRRRMPPRGTPDSPDLEVKRQRYLVALYRLKNNCVMNNNGARNFALRDGHARAKWVLPFDGNCFITPAAWMEIRKDVTESSHLKYFVVPMARVLSNTDLLLPEFVPEPTEEPQLIFRRDAREMFDEAFSYGRRPKVELFWRLQVSGQWDTYKDDTWDQPRRPVSPEARQFGSAGWAARLASGMPHLEVQGDQGADLRYLARARAILDTLRSLDASLSGASNEVLVSLRADRLLHEKRAAQHQNTLLRRPIEALMRTANEALARAPASLDKYDRTHLQRVFDDSLSLALAWEFTKEQRYTDHGARILEQFFVDPNTRMDPHLEFSRARPGHGDDPGALTGIIEMKDLYFYLDAARTLKRAGSVSADTMAAFTAWLSTYFEWLLLSPRGLAERAAKDSHGTCYDLQVASIASFLGDKSQVYEALLQSLSRIPTQFARDGAQRQELGGQTTAHSCCFNLQTWFNLAELASRWGIDLWIYGTREGAGLQSAARWLMKHMVEPWPYAQVDGFDYERLHPIWFAAAARVEGLPRAPELPASPYLAKPVYLADDGIRPFWNLGSYGLQRSLVDAASSADTELDGRRPATSVAETGAARAAET